MVAMASATFICLGSSEESLTTTFHVVAAALIHVNHILDCMDGQMARYRGTLSRSGSFFDKATDLLQVFIWLGAIAYSGYIHAHQDVIPIFLAFIGVSFYALRGYVKYVVIHSEMERDKEYVTEISRANAALQKQLDELGGLGKGLGNNLTWFLKEQKKLFNFDEGVFIFMLSLALIIPSTLVPRLWTFAVSQGFLGIIRCCQRGQELAHDQRPDPLKTPDK
jgi:phosphatidylglycerophosphate synthase